MKISEYPATLPKMTQYTAGEIAILYGVSHRTACKLIDTGVIRGHRLPGGKERRVLHEDLLLHARGNHGNFAYVLGKIEGLTDEEKTILPE